MKTAERISQNKTLLLGFLIAFLICPMGSYAQSGGGSGSKYEWRSRAQDRAKSRWTLQEWLEQKNRNSLMDQWLAMNSGSPFEFYLKGAYSSYESKKTVTTPTKGTSYLGSFGAYAQAVGLTGEYENNTEEHYNDVAGMLNIRILGSSLQTTSLTLHAGQRTRQFHDGTTDQTISNLLGQATLQIYITKYFGMQGIYRKYFPQDHSTLGTVDGTLVEGGLFIDFSGLRIYGNWSEDIQRNETNAGVETKYRRTGIKSGIQIFF